MCLLRLSPRPQLHALGWLAGLLSSKLSSAAVASPWMCYKGFLGFTPCIHDRLGSAKSFAALKTTPYKHHALHKNHVLAGPLQGLFASYRITLSMVAGGTRRRRLNRGTPNHPSHGWPWKTPTKAAKSMSPSWDILHLRGSPLGRAAPKLRWGGSQRVRWSTAKPVRDLRATHQMWGLTCFFGIQKSEFGVTKISYSERFKTWHITLTGPKNCSLHPNGLSISIGGGVMCIPAPGNAAGKSLGFLPVWSIGGRSLLETN